MATRYQIYSKYRNSRIINYNRWSEANEVKKLVEILVQGITSRKGAGYALNMRTLVMELYHSYLTDKDQYIAYFMSRGRYNFKLNIAKGIIENRYYKNPHITYDHLIGCIEHLAAKGYIENTHGGNFKDDNGDSYGFISRMRANESLADLWKDYKLTPDMITRFKPEEFVILRDRIEEEYIYKGKKKKRIVKPEIPYLDNTATIRMRKIIEAYNSLLERTHIDVDVDCMSQADKDAILDRLLHAKDKTKYFIDLSAKQVFRIFNNKSFKDGGRFYRAWWTGCPSIIRKYITINGEPTAELDYSGIHIHILYALKGINFPSLNTDAYELRPNDPDRELNKLILLTAYNAKSPKETAKAVFDKARNEGTLHIFKLKKHKQVINRLELLKQKHPQINGYIAENKGYMLQYHDSQVLEQLIDYYTSQNIPILTVHDSIICQRKYKDFVYEKMRELYTKYINKIFNCNLPYESGYPAKFQFVMKLQPQYKFRPIPSVNPILNMNINYRGTVYKHKLPIIKVKSTEHDKACSKACSYSNRFQSIKSGKRIFLGKIKLQYTVVDQVAHLEITQ